MRELRATSEALAQDHRKARERRRGQPDQGQLAAGLQAMKGVGHEEAGQLAVALLIALSGCVSLGKEPPPTLLTLTATTPAPAGLSASGKRRRCAGGDRARCTAEDRRHPRAGAGRRFVGRLPQGRRVGGKAYLGCSPSCSSETIRAKQTRMVIDGSDVRFSAATKLSGQLTRNDLRCGHQLGGRPLRCGAAAARRQSPDPPFREPRCPACWRNRLQSRPALNQAANKVAADVAAWIG